MWEKYSEVSNYERHFSKPKLSKILRLPQRLTSVNARKGPSFNAASCIASSLLESTASAHLEDGEEVGAKSFEEKAAPADEEEDDSVSGESGDRGSCCGEKVPMLLPPRAPPPPPPALDWCLRVDGVLIRWKWPRADARGSSSAHVGEGSRGESMNEVKPYLMEKRGEKEKDQVNAFSVTELSI